MSSPYPDVSDEWTISTNGGIAPRWRQDGSELFFVDAASMLVSVPVMQGERFGVGVARPLFELQAVRTDGWTYAVSADGQRILAARPTDAATTPITVVVNWTTLLKPEP